MADTLAKWKTLLSQTEVIYSRTDHLSTRTLDQLLEFESRAGFILPSEYKEFCQIFGPGYFTRYAITINCSSAEEADCEPISNLDTKTAIKGSYPYSESVNDLVDAAYIFGMINIGYVFLLFDLRSYRSVDESYDIYLLDDECENAAYCLGRSFFEFVRDVCLGERITLEFPRLTGSRVAEGFSPKHFYGRKAFDP
jgi:SMI1-KNR4 cell-wall